ncbi:MAG: hypothetical protein M3Y57_06950 [Acidobacteriota bacterium]|nr:hypothetical protein [Acidobacteriota bacterium]
MTFDPAKLKTEEDSITAGKEVFRYPVGLLLMDMLAIWRTILERSGVPPARDGTYPQLSMVVQKRSVMMAGFYRVQLATREF